MVRTREGRRAAARRTWGWRRPGPLCQSLDQLQGLTLRRGHVKTQRASAMSKRDESWGSTRGEGHMAKKRVCRVATTGRTRHTW